MPSTPPPIAPAAPAWPWWLAVAGGALALVVFVVAATQRVPYPHDLEWMEGALADHAWRVAQGLPLYCEPGPEHVPFLYAPLLFWLGALGIFAGVDGVLALRLVATACTLATALLIGHWVRRDCGRVLPGLAASGLFLAGYGWVAWWFDLARNDTLFVVLCIASASVLRHGGPRRWLWAALLATAALLAKQSASMWMPAVAVGAACVDWRTGLRFAAACAGTSAAALGLLHLGSDGWSTFYLFEMPRHHGWIGAMKLGFWQQDVVWIAPLLALALVGFVARCRAGDARGALQLAAFGCGGLITSWLSRLHAGGFDNVRIYVLAAACVLGPLAAARARGWWGAAGALLLVAQLGLFALAAWQRGPSSSLLPSAAHRAAHDELAAFVRAQPGPVWLPGHGGIGTRAGKGGSAHGQAIFDVLQPVLPLLPRLPGGAPDLLALADGRRPVHPSPRVQRAVDALLRNTASALQQLQFAAIVVDTVGTAAFDVLFALPLAGADRQTGTADDPYVRSPAVLVRDPAAIAPLIGFPVHSPYALIPR